MSRIVLAALAAMAFTGIAQAAEPLERIAFPEGATSATLSGRVSGAADDRYVLTAAEGQILDVTLDADQAGACFTLYTPAATEPTFTGGCNGQAFSAVLSEEGDYTIAVGAAPGVEASSYTLVVAVTNDVVTGAPVLPAE
ncbi:hypothetical protein [Falsirhodobacter algicola]|uniref:Uncharacterized protein n=1 Tax=Falsirhodobacter algicola TaxID=2692330 RepID=A0A8J8MTX1_9RHOB|nr:hypothetical protein [Falsirhodobacter algicola]QUS36662.1 hypothetical protein GR316_10540 [Falsirhodobacter algicola]